MSFVRRFQSWPGNAVLQQIEGVDIIDLPAPGDFQGVGTGVVGLVGEFADMTHAVAVDSTGTVTSKPTPVQVLGSKDLLDKLGGFDETLGEFGVSGGNGFVALRKKKYSALVVVPVNLASSKGVRLVRDLPTCKSATDPSPIVPIQPGTVLAGREFKSGANRVRVAAGPSFSADTDIVRGADGSVTNAAPATTIVFASAGSNFLTCLRPDGTAGVKKGDALVMGALSGAGAIAANADTFRVQAVTDLHTLVLEKQDGSSFALTTSAVMPFRVHPGAAADTSAVAAGAAYADVGAYALPARPLDITITAGTAVAPTVVPTASSATAWDPLSGLTMLIMPGGGGDLVYTAAVQAPNAVSAAGIEALYSAALDALLADAFPGNTVRRVLCARTSATIRANLRTHALDASARGLTRVAIISPALTTTEAQAVADADPGIGAIRDERLIYCWPGGSVFVPEAVGFAIKGADGLSYTDGNLDDRADGWMASILSVLAPERNPGQAASPVQEVMANLGGFQRGVSGLGLPDYILFKQRGIAALRFDPDIGWFVFQSGITTSLTSGQTNINRRLMADFIEDSIAKILAPFAKLPLSKQYQDAEMGECDAFLEGLKSPNNPPAQRINDYVLDDKSGNTLALAGAGIFVIIGSVQMMATQDKIVFQAQIGPTINVKAA